MSNSNNEFLCIECERGHFEKIEQFSGGDFNKDGLLPKICDNEQCRALSDFEKIIPDEWTDKSPYSQRKIDKIIDLLCCGGKKFDYQTKKNIKKESKDHDFYHPHQFSIWIMEYLERFGYIVNLDAITNTVYRYLNKMNYKDV